VTPLLDRESATVSVIVPTFNRAAMLEGCLRSVGEQVWPTDRLEVVVVDDGSTDATSRVAAAWSRTAIACLRQSNQGSAAARNTGAARASGQLLVFLDDDMILDRTYIAGLVDEHHCQPRVVSMATEVPWLAPDPTMYARVQAGLREVSPAREGGIDVDFTQCVTNNLAVERADFDMIGRMQDVAGDGATTWGDVDFGYRAARLGFRFRRSLSARCWHRDYTSADLASAARRAERVAMMAVPLLRRHPELADHLPMFRDKLPIDARSDGPSLIVRKVARAVTSTGPAIKVTTAAARTVEKVRPGPRLLAPLYRWIIGAHLYRGYRRGLAGSWSVSVDRRGDARMN
jgi:GT2 family glycosyltransferase